MPTIHSSEEEGSTLAIGSGNCLSWVGVRASGSESAANCCDMSVDRVRAESTGQGETAIIAGEIANSLAIARGETGRAIAMGPVCPIAPVRS